MKMSSVLTPEKSGRGWIMSLPPEMARVMGLKEGSIAVLYPQTDGLSYEILPPLPADMEASVLQTCEQFNEAFVEMKRLGD
jgi:phosphate uptake regulator